ncbi:MAG: hypothetical protein HC853_01185 [Anaerolineae bacterium]|nr:hypothetical protein [Anaerolineae bacterium]
MAQGVRPGVTVKHRHAVGLLTQIERGRATMFLPYGRGWVNARLESFQPFSDDLDLIATLLSGIAKGEADHQAGLGYIEDIAEMQRRYGRKRVEWAVNKDDQVQVTFQGLCFDFRFISELNPPRFVLQRAELVCSNGDTHDQQVD